MEYRQQAATATPEEAVPSPDTAARPAYMSLAAQYGIADEMDIGDSGPNEQTIEQEYQAYLKSPPTSKTVDIIKYWEVISEFISLHQLLTEVITDYRGCFPNSVPDGYGLPPDPSLICAL